MRSTLWRSSFLLLVALIAAGLVLGFAFAGSRDTLAKGVRIDGIDVGGMKAKDAQALLERRSAAQARRPVVFAAGARRFPIAPVTLGVQPDWAEAVGAAQRQSNGFGPLRGFKRIDVQFFGADVAPPVGVLRGALGYELELIARKVDRPERDASLAVRGAKVVVVPGRAGRTLDRAAAEAAIVRSLASLQRPPGAVQLPFRSVAPKIGAAKLARAAAQARRALSAPVELRLGTKTWTLAPERLALLLQLPARGETGLRIGGRVTEAWLQNLASRVDRPPRDATFTASGDRVRIVPSANGTELDPVRTADALLAAALRPTNRVADVVVAIARPKLSTQAAKHYGVTGVVGRFTTDYSGIPNRIHNVQLVAHLVDDKLIAPGTVFSFNGTTGARTAAKGFLEAPVIINGEVTTGLGGGVCQVSTTVFNAAFDAGLPIVTRTNHALYISHYPQGRDATVDYPDVDLKFRNDTGHWLLLRTDVGSYSLTVTLYGTPTGRKVESTTAPLVVHGKVPVKKTVDKTLKPRETIVDDPGEPAMTTSVTRKVYTAGGRLLDDDVFYSTYRAAPELVRVGPKPKKAKQKPAPKTQP
jgi:vancomycin resistance protein YoaR